MAAARRALTARRVHGLVLTVACFGCGNDAVPTPTPIPGPSPNPVGPYLGQIPPGASFVQFAAGILPQDIYNSPTVSPDGREIYWAARDGIKVTTMAADGTWSSPRPVLFGATPSTAGDDAPVVSPDYRTLFFSAQTPGAPSGYYYGYAERTASGWSERRALPVINSVGGNHFHLSVANSGTLYYTRQSANTKIYRSRMVGGVYEAPEPVEAANALGEVFCPFIAPDEPYLLFTRLAGGRVGGHYVTFSTDFRGALTATAV